ncbi:MAG: GTP cyclohydrolase II [Geminicoccaceae bacterium]
MLRLGGIVRIQGDGPGLDVIAAESLLTDARQAVPALAMRGRRLALTGQRLASLGIPADRQAVYLLPLARSDSMPGRLAMYVDPTAPAGESIETLALSAPTPDPQAAAAVELCKLAGLLPAAILSPLDADATPGATVSVERVMAYRRLSASTLRPVSEARVPLTDAEEVRIVAFRPADGGPDQFAILVGEPERVAAPLTRLHSECFTGDFLASLRCDCGDQLRGAIRRMAHEGSGVLLYLAQEGRGIGLTNKLRAYLLQDQGLDTVEANHHLGFGGDERDFWAAAAMLRQLGIERVRLLTNNPTKISQLRQYGIEVASRVPHIFEANAHNRDYLLTKALRSGHLLAVDDLQKPTNGAGAVQLTVA